MSNVTGLANDLGGDFRLGDDKPPVKRSSRLFRDGDDRKWYFTTREGSAIGPYPSRAAAQRALDDFIEFVQLAPLPTLVQFSESLTPHANDAD